MSLTILFTRVTVGWWLLIQGFLNRKNTFHFTDFRIFADLHMK